jgi:hypothetical protein
MSIPDRSTLKMARCKVTTDGAGLGIILLKIPGTSGVLGERIVNGGAGWFKTPHDDDYIKVFVTDEDDILGGGAGAQIGSYTDEGVPAGNQGWYAPKSAPVFGMHKIGDMNGLLMGGLYLKMYVQKGDNSVDDFWCNLEWGVNE